MSNDERRDSPAPGRNEPCHCGSGKKYKQCHLREDEAAAREARAQAAEAAAAEAEAAEPAEGGDAAKDQGKKRKPKREQTHQPWKRASQNTGGGFSSQGSGSATEE